MDRPDESIQFLRSQYAITKELGDMHGQCKATSVLALALESLGHQQEALKQLTTFASLADQIGETALQSQAQTALGRGLYVLGCRLSLSLCALIVDSCFFFL
jgi:hypothetical protein